MVAPTLVGNEGKLGSGPGEPAPQVGVLFLAAELAKRLIEMTGPLEQLSAMNHTERHGNGFGEHRLVALGGIVFVDFSEVGSPGPLFDLVVAEDKDVALLSPFPCPGEMIGIELVVLVEVGDQFAASLGKSGVASGRDAAIGRVAEHAQA